MFAGKGFRHQDVDVLPDELLGRVSEDALHGLAGALDHAIFVYGDQGVGDGVYEFLKMIVTGERNFGGLLPDGTLPAGAGHAGRMAARA